jgi:hypothetical protein
MLDQQKKYNNGELDVPILPRREMPLMPPVTPLPQPARPEGEPP